MSTPSFIMSEAISETGTRGTIVAALGVFELTDEVDFECALIGVGIYCDMII